MKLSILTLTWVGLVAFLSCGERKPNRAEIIKEADRRGMNIVDGVGYEASKKVGEELVELLRKVPQSDGKF